MEQGGLRGFDPGQQLALLRRKGQTLSPHLYREFALYLQILRAELLPAVQKALFELITDRGQNRVSALAAHSPQQLQQKIEQLVGRCSSLLTVEQLMNLSRQIQLERQRREQAARQDLLDSLTPLSGKSPEAAPLGGPSPGSFAGASVQLSIAPPLDQPDRLGGLFRIMGGAAESASGAHGLADVGGVESQSPLEDQYQTFASQDAANDQASFSAQMGVELDLLSSLLETDEGEMNSGQVPFEASVPSAAGGDADPQSDLQAEKGFLPESPLALAQWMDDLDLALTRRLRNLSHAINVELLRAGIVSSLLPATLLEAVLQGQVESQPAATNLLRLKVPVPSPVPIDQGMEMICLLLRSTELEFSSSRLRRCRGQLKLHRSTLLKMVQQERHWQRRAMLQEAEKLWWQTPPGSHSSSPPTRPPQA